MWRPLARRALLNRLTVAPKFNPPILHSQVPQHETVSIAKPAFPFSHYCSKSHFYQNPRFFSSNPSENHEDLPTAEGSETSEGLDFSELNLFDESTKPEAENEDFIFDDAVDDLEGNEDFGLNFGGGVAIGDENVGSVEVRDEIVEVLANDLQKVEDLLSLLQSSGTEDDGSLESKLEGMGLLLDEELVLKVLETPFVPGERLIGFFSWVMKKPDFKVTTQMMDNLVSAIGQVNRRGDIYALWDFVKEVGEKEKGVVTTECLNGVLTQLSMIGKGKAAFDVFNKFEEFGCNLNDDSYYHTIEVLCKRHFYDWACLACEKMLNADKLPDTKRVGKIISYLCRGGRTKDAHLVYVFAKDKKIYPPKLYLDILISSLSRIVRTDKGSEKEINKELDQETISLAIVMLDDYSEKDRKYATKPFTSVIVKLCWIEDVDRAKKLLLQMIELGPPPGNAVFNCVINGLAKFRDIEEAIKMMRLMESRGLKPDVYTYTVIMSAYVNVGSMEKACEIFVEAKKKHKKLTPVTYHTLIRGFCKLEQYNKAVNLLREMRKYGINPNHDEYNKLIKSLCLKALDTETAEKLEEEMRLNGIVLNSRTSALISAVKELKHGDLNNELTVLE